MMRAPVASVSSSISTPPTQRTAGRSLCISRWLASSSKPHWQMTRVAPLSLQRCTQSEGGRGGVRGGGALPQAHSMFPPVNAVPDPPPRVRTCTMSRKYCFSCSASACSFSTVSMSTCRADGKKKLWGQRQEPRGSPPCAGQLPQSRAVQRRETQAAPCAWSWAWAAQRGRSGWLS